MTNFDCQLDCIWNQLKPRLPGTLRRDFFFTETIGSGRPALNLGNPFCWQPTYTDIVEGNFAFCLLTLMTSLSILLLLPGLNATSSGFQGRLKTGSSVQVWSHHPYILYFWHRRFSVSYEKRNLNIKPASKLSTCAEKMVVKNLWE